jgi:hypothetical protein
MKLTNKIKQTTGHEGIVALHFRHRTLLPNSQAKMRPEAVPGADNGTRTDGFVKRRSVDWLDLERCRDPPDFGY